jgi:hypothetical protein
MDSIIAEEGKVMYTARTHTTGGREQGAFLQPDEPVVALWNEI